MAEMITRCPQCDTAFRITPGHLRSARGSVRCGSCLQVFNARENLTENSLKALAAAEADTAAAPEPTPAAATPAPTAPAPTAPAPATPAQAKPAESPPEPDSDDLLISDDMELADDFADTRQDPIFAATSPSEQSSLFEYLPREHSIDDEEDEDAHEDEAWALKLLEDDDPTPTGNLRAASTPHQDAQSDTAALSSSEEDDSTDSSREALFAYNNSDDSGLFADRDLDALTESDEDAEPYEPQPIAANRQDSTGSTYLDAIEPEPVEFAVRPEKRMWKSRLLWTLLSLVAFVALLGQVAWLQFSTWSRVEPYRGIYALACDVIGCQLPAQLDAEAIRTSNLVVRSHPREANALIVDVVLQNTAAFEQPFPSLELAFSDLNGKLVAQRRFSPQDYLGGELAGEKMMPVKQPVHIAIEIADPGSSAVNYRVKVVPPQSE